MFGYSASTGGHLWYIRVTENSNNSEEEIESFDGMKRQLRYKQNCFSTGKSVSGYRVSNVVNLWYINATGGYTSIERIEFVQVSLATFSTSIYRIQFHQD